MSKTLVLVKPDAVERGLVGAIISRIEIAGFKILIIVGFLDNITKSIKTRTSFRILLPWLLNSRVQASRFK